MPASCLSSALLCQIFLFSAFLLYLSTESCCKAQQKWAIMDLFARSIKEEADEDRKLSDRHSSIGASPAPFLPTDLPLC